MSNSRAISAKPTASSFRALAAVLCSWFPAGAVLCPWFPAGAVNSTLMKNRPEPCSENCCESSMLALRRVRNPETA